MTRQKLYKDIIIGYTLAVRELKTSFARSFLGPLWLFFTPLMMLAVYWFVFGVVLKVQWQTNDNQPIAYVLPFFSGLIFYLYFADIITSSLNIFVSKRSFVLRTPLSLGTIWFSGWLRCTIQFAPTLIILFVISSIMGCFSLLSLVSVLITTVTFALFTMGISLILASIGPFFGDIKNMTGPIMRAIFYSAPITYPLNVIPEQFSKYLLFNPLTIPVTQLREGAVFSHWPDPIQLGIFVGIAVLMGLLGALFLGRLGKVISDVI